ncbi:hypothetical protein EAH68_12800 [Corynebacterium hylobatis]|uniref:Uncharacterized protein n=1 Tax=Corynebacterium hylobatis TaxID=1859290 RepID=A0A430HVB9_9CORY|nr:hypothetical protein [Corynebacterium hylobatis]RSZ61535.1 hypothetical protein EAH68_12800 [Corynebacterium hylobatis]
METVKHRRPNGGKTPTGHLIPDTSTWSDLPRCIIAPTRSEDMVTISRDGEVLAWDVFTHHPVDIRRGDKVLIRGQEFTVEFTPFTWTPMTRRRGRHGTRFTATRKEG